MDDFIEYIRKNGAEHFSKNKSENKPKNGRIPSVC